MKKVSTIIFSLFFVSTCAFAQISETNKTQNTNYVNVNVTHEKPIYVHKGKYTYMFDKFGAILGYFRRTPSGKTIVYDQNGDIKASYKATPSGELAIYNSKGKRIN